MIDESFKTIKEEFSRRDFITGRRGINELNKRKLSELELDQIFNDWLWR